MISNPVPLSEDRTLNKRVPLSEHKTISNPVPLSEDKTLNKLVPSSEQKTSISGDSKFHIGS